MAIALTSKPNTNVPDSDYPYGQIRDNTGGGNGTPVNTVVYGDFHQFFAKLMDAAGISYNGLPDNAYSGFQLFEALMAVIGPTRRKVVEIGPWNMDSTGVKLVNTGVPVTKMRGMSFVIFGDEMDGGAIGSTASGTQSSMDVDISVRFAENEAALIRKNGGVYDGPAFDDGSINRGYLVIDYVI